MLLVQKWPFFHLFLSNIGQENVCYDILEQKNHFLQGHPMDLFLEISVLQAHFCWLGDVKEIIVLGRKVLLGKR